MKEAVNFLKNILKVNDTLIIANSGGPDSMCLFHVLKSLEKEYKLKIICAHVNHGLRKESDKEARFVQKYCEKNNITFEYMVIKEYENNKFSEEEARKKRYNFFYELMKKYKAKYLFTAHHGDDLIETVLMRIVRGSNIKGYIGIPKIYTNNNYKIVRPLLYTDKDSIMNYINEKKIPYVIDYTNDSEKYTRNRYRKHVLPFFKKEEKNVHLKFLKYSEELEKYNNYVNKIITEKIDKIYQDNKIMLKELIKEDKFIQEKIIEYYIEDIQKREILNINDKQFTNILELINSDKNRTINLANNFIAIKSYNYLKIEKNKTVGEYNHQFDKNIFILDKYKFEKIKSSDDKSNNTLRINSQEIAMPLHIRNRKNGDKIKVKNLFGTKKLKDIFIDSKIDRGERDEYPVVVDNNETVLWLPGIKKSIFDKEITEKYDIIIKYTEEKNE